MSVVSCDCSGRDRQRSVGLSISLHAKEGKEEVESSPWHLPMGFFFCLLDVRKPDCKGGKRKEDSISPALLRLVSL